MEALTAASSRANVYGPTISRVGVRVVPAKEKNQSVNCYRISAMTRYTLMYKCFLSSQYKNLYQLGATGKGPSTPTYPRYKNREGGAPPDSLLASAP